MATHNHPTTPSIVARLGGGVAWLGPSHATPLATPGCCTPMGRCKKRCNARWAKRYQHVCCNTASQRCCCGRPNEVGLTHPATAASGQTVCANWWPNAPMPTGLHPHWPLCSTPANPPRTATASPCTHRKCPGWICPQTPPRSGGLHAAHEPDWQHHTRSPLRTLNRPSADAQPAGRCLVIANAVEVVRVGFMSGKTHGHQPAWGKGARG